MSDVNKQLLEALRIARKKLEDEGYFPTEEIDLAIAAAEQAQHITDNTRVAWTSLGTVKAMLPELLDSDDVKVRENAQIIDALVKLVGCQQQAEPVARDVLMDALTELRAVAVEQCNVLPAKSALTVNDAFKLAYHIKRIDIDSIADRYAATASQARAIVNEQAEKLAKGRQQWEQISQPPAVAVAVPDGYALVPVEPTEEMLAAGQQAWLNSAGADQSFDIYRAMLAVQKGGA